VLDDVTEFLERQQISPRDRARKACALRHVSDAEFSRIGPERVDDGEPSFKTLDKFAAGRRFRNRG
jgi:hypothetical protein